MGPWLYVATLVCVGPALWLVLDVVVDLAAWLRDE